MTFLQIESLDQEGRGIARRDGKVIFIEGALPGESVEIESYRKKAAFEVAVATTIRNESASRTTPGCEFFGLCGGCSLQHMDSRTQVAAKQRVLEDTLTCEVARYYRGEYPRFCCRCAVWSAV